MMRFALLILALLAFIRCADYAPPPRPDAPASGTLLVVGSDFTTGFLSAVDPANLTVYRDIAQIYSDSNLRYSTAMQATFAVERLGADALRRLDNSAGYITVYEKSVGTQSNPQDSAFLPGNRIAVSYYNKNAVELLSASDGSLVSQIDLSSYADADGYAELGNMYYSAGFLYVAVLRLNRLATNAVWPPVGSSYLLKIDMSTYAVTAVLLPYSNPLSRLHFNAVRNSLIFAAPANFAANYQLDGACLEYSLTSNTILTPLATEQQLGYEIADCDLQADGSGVFIGYDGALNSVFGSFDSTAHILTNVAATLSRNNGGYFAGFLLHTNGKIYLGDRNIYNPGIRVFSGTTLGEIGGKTAYTGLPPYSLEEVP